MSEQNKPVLPPEFLEGPWLTNEEMIDWFKVTKGGLKSWRFRGKVAYSIFCGIIMYNKPWILQQLALGWTWKQPKPRKKKEK